MKLSKLSVTALCFCLLLLSGVSAQEPEKKQEAGKTSEQVETKPDKEKEKQETAKPEAGKPVEKAETKADKGKGKPEADKSGEPVEIKPGKEKGKQERFFAYPLPVVKEAMIDAMKAVEFEVKKDKDNHLEAKRKLHVGVLAGSGGETLLVDFQEGEESGTKGTRVIAETKKGLIGRAVQKSWAAAVLNEAERILKKEKGQP